ncbi:MAG: hypothetical protein R3F20_12200 [Planctomycetota bacterium]
MTAKPDDKQFLKRRAAAAAGDPEARTEPRTEEGTAAGEPGRTAQLIVDARRGAVDREAADAIARPLGDLAKAFALQAEVLQSVHETQARIQESLANDQRSEMMLNSTKALNETFKGVRGTQQELLEELRRERGAKQRWIWGFAALGLVVCGLAGWVWLDSRRQLSERNFDQGRRIDAVEGRVLAQVEATAERARESEAEFQRRLEGSRNDERNATQRFAAAEVELGRLRTELDGLKKQSRDARAEVEQLRSERGLDRNKIETLTEKNTELDRQLTFYMQKAEAAEAKALRLNDEILARLREQGTRAADVVADAPPPIVEGGKELAEALAASRAERVETPAGEGEGAAPTKEGLAPDEVEAIRTELNRLVAGHRGNSRFHFESIGGVADGKLQDVVFTETVGGRGVVKEVSAGRAELVLSARGDLVEFFFHEGTKRSWRRATSDLGPAFPFYNGVYRDSILCTNGDAWRGKSWSFLRAD